jgi:hypothetical protein
VLKAFPRSAGDTLLVWESAALARWPAPKMLGSPAHPDAVSDSSPAAQLVKIHDPKLITVHQVRGAPPLALFPETLPLTQSSALFHAACLHRTAT